MMKSKMINHRQKKQQETEESLALEAVRTLIRWGGDDPDRAGLQDTPARVLAFYKDFFSGRDIAPANYAGSLAPDVTYDDLILIRDIRLVSFCEHHMLPASGRAHIAYIPDQKIAGLGSFAKIAAFCSRRFTTQEAITNDIIEMIQTAFSPCGVAVMVSLSHGCMTLRDPMQSRSVTLTTKFSGIFQSEPSRQQQFLMLAERPYDKKE
ncbi:MAG: GTP cyclohydrolase I FolE [Alphaproteobacteria bacterium CG_4_9_14_3_um_filter_47_13]|nr:MAG: GTP cyclohydrolase I FolE [Alphaproteobacteria bacterium CG_4_9_14_3_um_filter_47_13]